MHFLCSNVCFSQTFSLNQTVCRIMILQKEKEQQSEQHEQTIRKLQARHETDISHLHQEHTLSAAKVYNTTTHPPLS